MKKTVKLNLLRSTPSFSVKNTHVYTTSDPQAPIPSVYIKKFGLPVDPPMTLIVSYTDETDTGDN